MKTPVKKSLDLNYLDIFLVVVDGGGGGVGQGDGHQAQGEDEELHCLDYSGRQMSSSSTASLLTVSF